MYNTVIRNTLCVHLILLFPITQGIIYGPSLEDLTSGAEVTESSSVSRRTIRLADYAPYYSVVVPLAANKTTAEPHLVRPVGEFSVEAPENMRIMAVIQSLHMRKKSVTSAFPPVCRDYLLFGDGSINRICGDVQKSDKKSSPNGMMGERTFLSPHNVLNVTVFTDVSTFVEEWAKKPNVVEISFTAYQNCPFYDPGMLNCLDNIIPHSPSCIPLNLSCDGVVNCGFLKDGSFSKDEDNCPPAFLEIIPPTESPPPITTTTTATAMITPKPGFPSWWDNYNNWNKMRSDHTNVFSNNWNSPYGDGDTNKYSEVYPKTIFDSDLKSSNGYWNSFILYALCLFVGVSGISVILKIISRFCADDKPPGVNSDSQSSLMRRNSSSTAVPIESDDAGEASTAGRQGLFAIPLPQIASGLSVPVPFRPSRDNYDYDCEPPPPYDSLFPDSNTNNL